MLAALARYYVSVDYAASPYLNCDRCNWYVDLVQSTSDDTSVLRLVAESIAHEASAHK